MLRLLFAFACFALIPSWVAAQSEGAADEDERAAGEGEPRLRAPELESLQMPSFGEEGRVAPADEDMDLAAEDTTLLEEAAPMTQVSDPTLASWSSPASVFTLHGYFRVRGELWDNFNLGRLDSPFSYFLPADRGVEVSQGGCRGAPTLDPSEDGIRCDPNSDQLRFANMRLRLKPTLAVSDDVRIHMMIDVLDNVVLGSTASTKVFDEAGAATGINGVPGRVPGAPIDTYTTTVTPNGTRQNAARDTIVVRRAWGEVTNRTLGQLRFGRMGHQWGMGMLYNAGDGLDADFQSDIDRIQVLSQFKGFHFGVSWDFPSEGAIFDPGQGVVGVPFDLTALDDVRQWSFLVGRRMEPWEQRKRLDAGKWVLNGGIYFVYRKQNLSSSQAGLFVDQEDFATENLFVRRGAKMFVPDLWAQFLWKGMRVETEFAYVAGKLNNIGATHFIGDPDSSSYQQYKSRAFGWAFEFEYRLVSDKLGIYFNTGIASGDANSNGLSDRENLIIQDPISNTTLSNFAFHPNYRIDLIFWRHIMGRIDGAWYLNPAVSYDIIRNPFGQVFGARANFVYSQAMKEQQAYGSEAPLGFEIDASVYYRSEDGPSFLDGYSVRLEYGLFFPFAGLGLRQVNGSPPATPVPIDVNKAWNLRLLLGIQF